MEIQPVLGRIGAIYDNTKGGKSIVKFSLAENKYWGGENHTTWYNFTAFDKTAQHIIKHFAKGDMIFVTGGRVQPSTYTKDGVEVRTIEIICNAVEFVPSASRKDDSGDSAPATAPATTEAAPAAPSNDDIPF